MITDERLVEIEEIMVISRRENNAYAVGFIEELLTEVKRLRNIKHLSASQFGPVINLLHCSKCGNDYDPTGEVDAKHKPDCEFSPERFRAKYERGYQDGLDGV